jgi:hypothetical protein
MWNKVVNKNEKLGLNFSCSDQNIIDSDDHECKNHKSFNNKKLG